MNSNLFALAVGSGGAVFDLNLKEDQRFLLATVALLDLIVLDLTFRSCCSSCPSRGMGGTLSSVLTELISESPDCASTLFWEAGSWSSFNTRLFSVDDVLLLKPTVATCFSTTSTCFARGSIEELLWSECSPALEESSLMSTNGKGLVVSTSGEGKDATMEPIAVTSAEACILLFCIMLKFSALGLGSWDSPMETSLGRAGATSAEGVNATVVEDGEGDTLRLFSSLRGKAVSVVELVFLFLGGEGETFCAFSTPIVPGASVVEPVNLLLGEVDTPCAFSALIGPGASVVEPVNLLLGGEVDTPCAFSALIGPGASVVEPVNLLLGGEVDTPRAFCVFSATSESEINVMELVFLLTDAVGSSLTSTFLEPVVFARLVLSTSLLANKRRVFLSPPVLAEEWSE